MKRSLLIGAGVAVGILTIYRLTASPTISWVDSGVIAAAAKTLGIANPPGFPAYMLIGHLFTKIPWGSVVSRLQLLSQLSALGIAAFTYWMVTRQASRRSGLFAAVAIAFSYGLWQQANNVETYTLTNFVLFLLLGWTITINTTNITNTTNKPILPIKILGLGFIAGLAMGLNPTISALVPAAVYWMVTRRNAVVKNIRIFAPAALFFVIGVIIIYSYLPIRAAAHPFVNWGDPVNWDRIRAHLFGAGLNIYEPETNSINGFTGQPKIWLESFLHYWHLALFQFTPILFPLIGIGAIRMWKDNRWLFGLLATIALTNMTFVTLYYGGNQESWMITSWVVFAVWMGVGVERISKHTVIALSFSLIPLIFWYPILNHSAMTFADDYADNLYKNVPEGSIIVGGGDFFNSLTAYTHEVTGQRKDIIPVTGNMYYIFDWYRQNLTINTDLVISASTSAVIKYKRVDEFTDAVDSLVTDNPNKQVFVTPLLLRDSVVAGTKDGNYHTKKYDLLPHGLLLKVVAKGSTQLPNATLLDSIAFAKPPFYLERNYKNAYRLLRHDYASSYQLLGNYWQERGDGQSAHKAFARSIDLGPPDSPEYIHRLAIYYAQSGNNVQAKAAFEKALALAPDDSVIKQNYQTFLGSTASASANLAIADGTKQTVSGLSFTTPAGWTTAREGNWVMVTAPAKDFALRMRRTRRPASISIESFLASQATIAGQLLQQGQAKIPNTDIAFVKVWSDAGKTNLQFFLFIADAVVEIIVGPADSPRMRDFDAIASSLKLL